MKRIILVRHAKAADQGDFVSDHERRLLEKGRLDAIEVAQRAKSNGYVPEKIFASTAIRAKATARIFASELGYPENDISFEQSLYGETSDATIISLVKKNDGGLSSIMIVGHDPSISEATKRLAKGFAGNVPTSGIAVIDIDTDSWEGAIEHKGTLIKFDFPGKASSI
jgi:phosphohistidine phosphatase